MDRVVERYRQLGVEVVDRDLPVDAQTMARVFDPIVVSEIWSRYGEDWRTRPQLFSAGFAEFFKTRRRRRRTSPRPAARSPSFRDRWTPRSWAWTP